MKRKSPIEHTVSSYTRRDGKRIDKYRRGSGDAPRQSKPSIRSTKAGSGYYVTLTGSGKSESYKGYGSPVSSLRQAVGKLQQPIVPTMATLRRIG